MADPNLNLRSATQILRQSHTLFTTHFPTFLTLSLLIFLFRTSVESATQLLTTFVDRDPSLQSLLSRLHLHDSHLPQKTHPFHPNRKRVNRNRPFLQLTRVGTLENDFFADDDDGGEDYLENERLLRGGRRFKSENKTFVRVDDTAVELRQVVYTGVTFDFGSVRFDFDMNKNNISSALVYGDGGGSGDREEEEVVVGERYPMFMRNLDISSRDSVAILCLVCLMSAAYGWVILGFLVTYSWVLGIVFVAVVNDLLGKEVSFFRTFYDGCRLGMRRLSSFILLRWAIRDAFTQLLGLWYFGEIEDQYSFFRVFVRFKLMPFSIMSPWGRGFENEILGFVAMWFLIDGLVSFVFSVVSWVVIVNVRRRGGREMVKEGCYLLSTMWSQAVILKCLEFILTGSLMRHFTSRVCGKYLASYFQAAQEVFFTVAWLVFYLAARCRVQHTGRRVFGRRDLEGFAEDFR